MLKVYACNYDGRTERLVATTSKKRASSLIGVTYGHFLKYGHETGAEYLVKACLAKPGTVFEKRCTYSDIPKEIAVQPSRTALGTIVRSSDHIALYGLNGWMRFYYDEPGYDREFEVEKENLARFVAGH